MKNCLDDANINTSDVDLINMHGTSTPLGDVAESKAVKDVFQEDAYNLNINSTKSMTGHLLGAAGAVEAISCIMAIKHGIIPPTINHFNDDENIDPKLNFTFTSPQNLANLQDLIDKNLIFKLDKIVERFVNEKERSERILEKEH